MQLFNHRIGTVYNQAFFSPMIYQSSVVLLYSMYLHIYLRKPNNIILLSTSFMQIKSTYLAIFKHFWDFHVPYNTWGVQITL